MLDINKRVRCEGTTVAEMIEASQGKRKVISTVIQRVKQ